MEFLMARVSLQIAAAMSDPKKPPPKIEKFLRYHDDAAPKELTAEDFAKMYGAVKKNG
jgi:hypothetical protein